MQYSRSATVQIDVFTGIGLNRKERGNALGTKASSAIPPTTIPSVSRAIAKRGMVGYDIQTGEKILRRSRSVSDAIVIYTHPDCGYSARARDELVQNEVEFTEVDLSVSPELWVEVERLTGGERMTPVIVEGELVTVGFHGLG